MPQGAPPRDILKVNPEELIFCYEASTQAVTVITTADSYAANSDDDWITIVYNMDGTFSVTVSDNNTGTERTGAITVNAGTAEEKTVTVIQAARDNLSVNPTTLNYSYDETDFQSVVVITSADVYSATSNEDWVLITENDGSFEVNVLENTTSEERTATITITAGTATPVTVTVTQGAQYILAVIPPSITVPGNDQSLQQYTVVTNSSSWNATTDANWLQLGQSDDTLTAHAISGNNTGSSRTAIITVTAGNATPVQVTFTQTAQDTLSCDPDNIQLAALIGLSIDVDVTTTASEYLAVSNNTGWLTVVQVGNIITVVALTNLTGQVRVGTITVTAGTANPVTITVTQAAQDILSVEPTSLTYEASGTGSQVVNVTTTAESFTATPSDDWITAVINSEANTAHIEVGDHDGEDHKNGVVVFDADSCHPVEVIINQTPEERISKSISLSRDRLSFGSSEPWGEQQVTVETDSLWCTWETKEDWIILETVGSLSFKVKVLDNDTFEERTGIITVLVENNQAEVTVVQARNW